MNAYVYNQPSYEKIIKKNAEKQSGFTVNTIEISNVKYEPSQSLSTATKTKKWFSYLNVKFTIKP